MPDVKLSEYSEQKTEKEQYELILEYTRQHYGQYRDAYEQFQHEPLRENYQLMFLYDDQLVKRQQEATRLIRSTYNIPKMQPEIFSRLAQETQILLAGRPTWKVNPPANANERLVKRCKNVQDLVGDVMAYTDWYWAWYSAAFWASIAPCCALEVMAAREDGFSPTGEVDPVTKRLIFDKKTLYNGAKTVPLFPWEIFWDITLPGIEPPVFKRFLISDDELEYRLLTKDYVIPEGKDKSLARTKSGSIRNYGLEIVRSVPRKAGSGVEEKRPLKDQHEVLMGIGYFNEDGKRILKKWWVLNGQCVVKGPEDVTGYRTQNPFILSVARQVPGFSFGMCPGDSAKQIQRGTNHVFNAGAEVMHYGLGSPLLAGENAQFEEDKPTWAPATIIRMSGDVNQVKPVPVAFDPSKIYPYLGYMDEKGMLVTDTNPGSLGQLKRGTPPSAKETGEASSGGVAKLGMFMLTDERMFKEWARKVYWTVMEKSPAAFEVNGRAYDLKECIVGEPDFDLPHLGEAAGRASDVLTKQVFYSKLYENPVFVNPAETEETNPRMFALIRSEAAAMGITDVDKVLNPAQADAKIEPAGIPDEVEVVLDQLEKQDKAELAAMAESAAKETNGTLKGAKNGKEQTAKR